MTKRRRPPRQRQPSTVVALWDRFRGNNPPVLLGWVDAVTGTITTPNGNLSYPLNEDHRGRRSINRTHMARWSAAQELLADKA